MSAASYPNFVPQGGDADTVQADIARGRKAIEAASQEGITYQDDKESRAMYRDSREYRVARVRCGHCTTTSEIHQVRDVSSGQWPNEHLAFSAMGWKLPTPLAPLAFCGATCARHYAVKMASHGNQPLPPVLRVNDESYARKHYQVAPAPVAVPAKKR